MLPAEDINPLRAISSYGGDSFAAVELCELVREGVGGECEREERNINLI